MASNKRAGTAPKTSGARRAPLPGYWAMLAGSYGALAVMFLMTEMIRVTLGRWPGLALVAWLLVAAALFAGMVLALGWWQERQG